MRRGRHRPLRPRPSVEDADGRRPPPARGRRRQGPELLPLWAAPGPARPRALPAGRPDQARGPRDRAIARPGHGRQAREPGAVLRARRRLPDGAARSRRLAGDARAAAGRGRARTSASTGARPRTRSASARASASRWASRATSAASIRCTNTIQLARRADLETREFEVERVLRGRRATCQRAGRRSGSATGRRSCRPRSRRWTAPRAPGASSTDDPVWAAAPGQACVFYAGDEVLGGGRIAAPAAVRAA